MTTEENRILKRFLPLGAKHTTEELTNTDSELRALAELHRQGFVFYVVDYRSQRLLFSLTQLGQLNQ